MKEISELLWMRLKIIFSNTQAATKAQTGFLRCGFFEMTEENNSSFFVLLDLAKAKKQKG
jgi:hypothetical protein